MSQRFTIIDSGKHRTRTAQSHLRAAEMYARHLYPAKRFPLMHVRRISGKPNGDGQFLPILTTTDEGEPFIVQKGA